MLPGLMLLLVLSCLGGDVAVSVCFGDGECEGGADDADEF